MAKGTVYQGPWQAQEFQGPWKIQAQEFQDTLSDGINLTDALVVNAQPVLADALSLTDGLVVNAMPVLTDGIALIDSGIVANAKHNIADTISLLDSLAAAGAGAILLADGITLTDALVIAADLNIGDSIALVDSLAAKAILDFADGVSLTDNLTARAIVALADSLGLSENLQVSAQKVLSDNLTLTDVVQALASLGITDNISLTDGLLAAIGMRISDGVTITDNLSGVLTSVIEPATSDVLTYTVNAGWQGPRHWRVAVGVKPKPITEITQSSANTTYGDFTIDDASAWDLTSVRTADVLITEDGFHAIITGIGSDQLTVDRWMKNGTRVGTKPTDGQTATVHYAMRAQKVLLEPGSSNTQPVYINIGGPGEIDTGHPIPASVVQSNSSFTVRAPRALWLNMSQVWAVAGSSQSLLVTPEAESRVGGGAGQALSGSISDGITLTDNLVGVLIPGGPDTPIYNDVVVDGPNNRMYCAIQDAVEGGGVLVYDITNKLSPTRLGYFSATADALEAPKRIVKGGDWVYTSDRLGLRSVDVSDPTSMSLGQKIDILALPITIPGVPTVAVTADKLFLQGRNMGVRRYNCADPTALALESTLAHGATHYDTHVGGSAPYICMPWYAMPYGGHGDDFVSYDWVYTDGTYVYMASDNTVWVCGLTGNFPSDTPVLDPGNLVAIHTALVGPLGSSAMIAHASSGNVVVSYNTTPGAIPAYGYMASRFTGTAWNASVVLANANVGSISAPANGYAKFVVNGTEGYIVGTPGLVILTLGSGAVLFTLGGTYRGHDVVGNYLYLAVYEMIGPVANHRVDIYDISTPGSPILMGSAT